MIEFIVLRSSHDELRRGRIPHRRVLSRFAVPGGILLSYVPARLVLKPVMSSRENRAALVPDDLLVMHEADLEQTIEHFTREFGCVPDVADLQAGNESERLRPVCARIRRYGRIA